MSQDHETRSKRKFLFLASRTIMRRCLTNISDMNVEAAGLYHRPPVAADHPLWETRGTCGYCGLFAAFTQLLGKNEILF